MENVLGSAASVSLDLPSVESIAADQDLQPWVVLVVFLNKDQQRREHAEIVMSSRSKAPGWLGTNEPHTVLRAETFLAEVFDKLDPRGRRKYRAAYAAWLMHQAAERAGKNRNALIPWLDYDPIVIDAAVENWLDPHRELSALGG